jgi:hypothetical protein
MKKSSLIATTLLLLVGSACAQFPDMPLLKEGLWKIHMTDTDASGKTSNDSTTSLCRNHAYDVHVRELAANTMKACTTVSDTKLLGKRTITLSCKIGGSTVTTKSVISSSGEDEYHTESFTTYNPALYGATQSTMVQEQTYAGACPAGMSPGDRKLADGTIQKHH